MNKFSVELKDGISYAKPCINKFSDGFDTIEFVLDSDESFSTSTFAIVYSFCGKTGMSIQDGGNFEKTIDDENNKIILTWSLGTNISCESGVVLYQIVAYNSADDGTVSAIWYSPQGRIVVGDSIDTTEYETLQISAEPSLVAQLITSIDSTKNDIENLNTKCEDNAQDILNLESETAYLSDKLVQTNSDIDLLSDRVDANASSINANAQSISQVSDRVDANASSINANAQSISQVSDRVDANASSINANAQSISQLSDKVDANASSISVNAKDILQMSDRIYANTSGITENAQKILRLSDKTDANASGITANTQDILRVSYKVDENTNNIMANAQRITQLNRKIDENTSSIMSNVQSISQLSDKSDQINIELQTKAQNLENDISQVSKNVDAVSDKIDNVEIQLDEKVDKQSGKQLSTEDYTTSEKQKLNELSNAVAVDGDGNVDIKGGCSVKGIDILSQMDAINLSAQDGIKALQSKSIPYEDISGYPVSVSDHLEGESVIDYKVSGNSVQDGTPSIENPIEVQSVGDLITDETSEYYGKYDVPVTVTGKNLFNINGNINQFYPGLVMSGPNSNTNNGNGSITIHATTSATAGSGFKITNVAGKKYTFSCDVIDNGTGEGITVITCIPSQINYNVARNTAGKRMVFTVSFTEDIYEAIFSFATTKGVNGIVSNVQIELSDTATEYEPYIEETKHIYLDEPLRKFDEYADYIDFKNQKVVRNIKRLTVDGTESGYAWGNWASESDKTTMVFTFQVSNSIKPLSRLGKLYSDEFKPLEQLEFNNDKEGIFQGGDTFHIRINKSRLNGETVNDFKNWLSSNNIYVYYILKTPIEEQITIPKLCTPKSEVMNISSGTTLLPSSMDIKYYQDIKKIINNLTNAILSQGGDV